ncbi:MAG: FAD-dependent oxidoreductase, partial [Bdellovibrionales bacterium]|nr:FAD-dependent oxidoreductase [Bdellovibrionales bacterium]
TVPLIGLSPFTDHQWIATGFSGDGLTAGTFAGGLLARLISKEEDPSEKFFSPSRMEWITNKEFFSKNAHTTSHLIKDHFLSHELNPSHLAPGEGEVSLHPLGSKAYYRNEEGILTECSAKCLHMGCFVKWNAAEKSFDCPCHGSRFNVRGEVLEGPSLKNLKRTS